MIKKIKITNFKSISSDPIYLNKFNVFIGPNASGKSNVIDIFRFIQDIVRDGLTTAVGRRFGWENVLRRDIDKSSKIIIEFDCSGKLLRFRIGKKTYYNLQSLKYFFEAGYKRQKYFINSEKLELKYSENGNSSIEKFIRSQNEIKIIDSLLLDHNQLVKKKTINIPLYFKDQLFITGNFFLIGANYLANYIKEWRFYEIDVNASRQPCVDESFDYLLPNGSNLASILDKSRRSSVKKKKIINRIKKLMKRLVPSFEDWNTERQFDGSLGFKIKEKGIKKGFLPKMVSDGTIRLLSILLALLYQPEQTKLICIDEPERHLHPQVLEDLVDLMRDLSDECQILIATHSPEVVKYLNPNEVFLVNKINNITHIVPAKNISMIEKFLEEFTLDELWLKGYLDKGTIL